MWNGVLHVWSADLEFLVNRMAALLIYIGRKAAFVDEYLPRIMDPEHHWIRQFVDVMSICTLSLLACVNFMTQTMTLDEFGVWHGGDVSFMILTWGIMPTLAMATFILIPFFRYASLFVVHVFERATDRGEYGKFWSFQEEWNRTLHGRPRRS
jgi:hypothetical protein